MAGIPKHLDQKAAKAAMRGKKWGEKDQRRYDKAMGTYVGQKQARDPSEGGLRQDYAALQAKKEEGAEFSQRAQNIMERKGRRIEKRDARKAAKARAQAAQGSTGQPTNPIDDSQTGTNDSVPDNEMVRASVMPMPENPTIYDGYGNVKVEGNDNQVGDGNVRSGRDSNIGDNSGSHTVGDNNSGTVGNNNAVVENKVDNSQEQKVNQDNDINNNINGDNNKTFINQDNSVRNYGGDNRNFVYNSSGGMGALYDSPVSAATMGGFYDVDDSPAAQAGFVDMYKDFNKDNGTRFAGQALQTVEMFSTDARDYKPEDMENWLNKSTQYSYDKGDAETSLALGDIWNKNYTTAEWKMPSPPKEIESNAEEIADKAKDDIDDV